MNLVGNQVLTIVVDSYRAENEMAMGDSRVLYTCGVCRGPEERRDPSEGDLAVIG